MHSPGHGTSVEITALRPDAAGHPTDRRSDEHPGYTRGLFCFRLLYVLHPIHLPPYPTWYRTVSSVCSSLLSVSSDINPIGSLLYMAQDLLVFEVVC